MAQATMKVLNTLPNFAGDLWEFKPAISPGSDHFRTFYYLDNAKRTVSFIPGAYVRLPELNRVSQRRRAEIGLHGIAIAQKQCLDDRTPA